MKHFYITWVHMPSAPSVDTLMHPVGARTLNHRGDKAER